jgi:hypothetical protein
MKARPPIKPILRGKNVVSINLLRLRRLVARLNPAMVARMGKTQHGNLRRAANRAKTGGHCKG